jgi:hypothetical protein
MQGDALWGQHAVVAGPGTVLVTRKIRRGYAFGGKIARKSVKPNT